MKELNLYGKPGVVVCLTIAACVACIVAQPVSAQTVPPNLYCSGATPSGDNRSDSLAFSISDAIAETLDNALDALSMPAAPALNQVALLRTDLDLLPAGQSKDRILLPRPGQDLADAMTERLANENADPAADAFRPANLGQIAAGTPEPGVPVMAACLALCGALICAGSYRSVNRQRRKVASMPPDTSMAPSGE